MIIGEKFLKSVRDAIANGDYVTKNIKVHSMFDRKMKLLQTVQPRLSNEDIVNAALSEYFSNNEKIINDAVKLSEKDSVLPTAVSA